MIKAFPLSWPDGWKRATQSQRRPGHFNRRERKTYTPSYPGAQSYTSTCTRDLTVADAVSRVLSELDKMGVDQQDVIVSTNVRTRLDGMPRSGEPEPDDPGAAVYWRRVGEDMRCMAVDSYDRVADNLAAIAATLEALRAIERHGGAEILNRAFRGFAALPEQGTQTWRETLGIALGTPVTLDVVESSFKQLALVHHPDKGGDADQFHAIVTARNAARQELGETR